MSTPQDPHNPGETPRDPGATPPRRPPHSSGGPAGQHGEPPVAPDSDGPGRDESTPAGRTPEAPDEPFVTPTTPPDHPATPRYSPPPQPEPGGAQFGSGSEATEASAPTGGRQPSYSEDPPTEYLPKIVHRGTGADSDRTGTERESPEAASSPADDHPTQMLPQQSGRPGEPGGEAPRTDKGTEAYTHGWQPGPSDQQPGQQPMGEVPPQAWSARPEEQEPGQAWQPQAPGQPGYSEAGGTPYPPAGAYGGRSEQPGEHSGWGRPPGRPGGGTGPAGQQGWSGEPGAEYDSGAGRPGQQGWGDDQSGQQGWGPGQSGQQGWGGERSGQQGWSGDQSAQQGWSGDQSAQQGWSGDQSRQQGWSGDQSAQQGWSGDQSAQHGWGSDQSAQQGWSGGQQPGGYPAYPQQQQYQPYGATQPPERSGPQVLSIIGFVCAAVSLLFCPLLFGIAGIVLGVVGHIRGESLGKWAAIAAGVCLVIGVILALTLSGMGMVPIEST